MQNRLKKSLKTVRGNLVNLSSHWEGSIYSSFVSIFTKEGSLDMALFEVGESLFQGLTSLGDDDRICSEYGKCTTPCMNISSLCSCLHWSTRSKLNQSGFIYRFHCNLHSISIVHHDFDYEYCFACVSPHHD